LVKQYKNNKKKNKKIFKNN